jgi:hypothetical protein
VPAKAVAGSSPAPKAKAKATPKAAKTDEPASEAASKRPARAKKD